jgi:hypothetical protein
LQGETHRYAAISTDMFVTREKIDSFKIGVGEDVFMIGRFVDHDGGPINRPSARFGNISVMPFPIKQPNGYMADSYCIDLHSRTGYSGSPVFLYRTATYDLENPETKDGGRGILMSGSYLALLGIHYAQFAEEWGLSAGALQFEQSTRVPVIKDGASVRGLSGMSIALPAWSILTVLNAPQLKQQRDVAEAQLREQKRREGMPPYPE